MALMEASSAPLGTERRALLADPEAPSAASAVSWGAILAGAAAAAALSMILLLLGTGMGLSSISPWASRGADAATFGFAAIVWVTVTQLLASGMGGYLAGRLRSKWVAVAGDETYFRDTAHGFLSWAVASLLTAGLLGAVVGSGLQAGAAATGRVAAAGVATAGAAVGGMSTAAGMDKSGGASAGMDYFVDALFRRDAAAAATPPAAPAPTDAGTAAPGMPPSAATTPDAPAGPLPSAEVSRIFADGLRTGALPPDDLRYVGQLVAQRTGMPAADAEKRVAEVYGRLQTRLQDAANQAREAADKARKATVYATLWLFVALLAGAFAASLAATFGGRERDL